MLTFLPSKIFTVSAKALDDERLLGQVGEARAILEAVLAGEKKGHPAFDMWREHPGHLAIYGKIMSDERNLRWGTRTELFFVHHIPSWFWKLGVSGYTVGGTHPENRGLAEIAWDPARDPWWLGDRRLHLSHIRALYEKDHDYYGRWKDVRNRPFTPCCVGCDYWWPTHVRQL